MEKGEEGDQRIRGRDLEKQMAGTGFKSNWMKLETAAQDRARWRREVCGLCSTGLHNMKNLK